MAHDGSIPRIPLASDNAEPISIARSSGYHSDTNEEARDHSPAEPVPIAETASSWSPNGKLFAITA